MGIVNDFKGGGDFGRIGEGTFPARVVQVIDLGRQEGEYQGVPTCKPTLWITFELPTETITIDGVEKPRWLSKEFTKSTNEKAWLMKLMTGLYTSDEIDDVETFEDFLGRPLLVEVGTTSGGKDKLVGCTKLVAGMKVAELYNDTKYFDIESPNTDVFESLPDFLQEKIKESPDCVPFS